MPALAYVAVAHREKPPLPIPVPLFLLWPAALVGWLVVATTPRDRRRDPEALAARVRVGLAAFKALSGLRVDVASADGHRVKVRVW